MRMILRLSQSHNSNNLYLPIDATQIPPSAKDNGPPQVKNFPSGAQAAVKERAATVPTV